MRTEAILFVGSNGQIEVIGDAPLELEQIGDCRRERVSSIVPVNPWKRAAFILLRAMFGERGRVAEWTRSWHGPWSCWVFATGERYEHQSRRCCIAWERERLAEHMSK